MALREQPYMPLYVQDFLTDEKLAECSAESTGVYIRLMCLMHKSSQYGVILLKQKDRQNASNILNFACKLARQMPYSVEVIERSLSELVEEDVLQLEGDVLYQKRMVKDANLSDTRASAGRRGGKASKEKSSSQDFACNFAQAKLQANTENEIENEYESEIEEDGKSKKEEKTPPAHVAEFAHQPNAYLLAQYLDKRICQRCPTVKAADEKTLQRWANAFDRCNRIDGHTWDEIKLVLKFSQDDSFWQANILSGQKFRDKYVQLLAKMQSVAQTRSSRGGRSAPPGRNEGVSTHGQPISPLGVQAVKRMLEEDAPEGGAE